MAITAIVLIIMDGTIHFSSSYSLCLSKSKLRWWCSNCVVVLATIETTTTDLKIKPRRI
ncbi:hypothetical protein Hanom_Chr02g00131241 [Helianthus anomalus]